MAAPFGNLLDLSQILPDRMTPYGRCCVGLHGVLLAIASVLRAA
jgi:hypothetical protein